MRKNLLQNFLFGEVEFAAGFVIRDKIAVNLRVDAAFSYTEEFGSLIDTDKGVVQRLIPAGNAVKFFIH